MPKETCSTVRKALKIDCWVKMISCGRTGAPQLAAVWKHLRTCGSCDDLFDKRVRGLRRRDKGFRLLLDRLDKELEATLKKALQ